MSGLRRICKLYGRMQVGDTLWLWDYAKDEPVIATEMPAGSARRKASDKAWAELLAKEYGPMTEQKT